MRKNTKFITPLAVAFVAGFAIFGGGANAAITSKDYVDRNLDTKLNKVGAGTGTRTYIINPDGTQTVRQITSTINETTLSSYQLANTVAVKNYVDSAIPDVSGKLDKVTTTSSNNQIYIKTTTGSQSMTNMLGTITETGNGIPNNVAVYNAVSPKLDKVTSTSDDTRVYVINPDGTQTTMTIRY
ncbi:MAG: hypothetical protein LBL75_00435 [Rickettsiales bacterium]|nr:hypothetical protein [Rickettsiales bacterium]